MVQGEHRGEGLQGRTRPQARRAAHLGARGGGRGQRPSFPGPNRQPLKKEGAGPQRKGKLLRSQKESCKEMGNQKADGGFLRADPHWKDIYVFVPL